MIEKYKPAIICLQETKLANKKQIQIKNYTLQYKPATTATTNTSAGIAIYTYHKITQ